MGSLLGLTVMYVTGYRKKVTMDNLRRAFPEKTGEELDDIAHGAYRNYGRAILEMLWAGGQSADVLRARIHPRNMEVLRECPRGGTWGDSDVRPLRLVGVPPYRTQTAYSRTLRRDRTTSAE